MLFIIVWSYFESYFSPSSFSAFSISVTEINPSWFKSKDLKSSAKGYISLAGSWAHRKATTTDRSLENLVIFFIFLKSTFNLIGFSMVILIQGCSNIWSRVNLFSTGTKILFIKSLSKGLSWTISSSKLV